MRSDTVAFPSRYGSPLKLQSQLGRGGGRGFGRLKRFVALLHRLQRRRRVHSHPLKHLCTLRLAHLGQPSSLRIVRAVVPCPTQVRFAVEGSIPALRTAESRRVNTSNKTTLKPTYGVELRVLHEAGRRAEGAGVRGRSRGAYHE
jgi:hypothetical protein